MRAGPGAGFAIALVGLLIAFGGSVSRQNVKAAAPLERFEEVKDWPRLPPDVQLGEVSGVATAADTGLPLRVTISGSGNFVFIAHE